MGVREGQVRWRPRRQACRGPSSGPVPISPSGSGPSAPRARPGVPGTPGSRHLPPAAQPQPQASSFPLPKLRAGSGLSAPHKPYIPKWMEVLGVPGAFARGPLEPLEPGDSFCLC